MNSSDLQVNLVSPFQELIKMIILNNEYSDNELKFNDETNNEFKSENNSNNSGSTQNSPNQSCNMINQSITKINFPEHSQLISPTFSNDLSSIYSPGNQKLSNKCKNRLRSEQLQSNLSINQNKYSNRNLICTFCKNNGEPEHVYRSHIFRDYKNKLCCPILRLYKCPICGESGANAHTITYCQKYKYSKLNSMINNITA